jgi:hypothetical protein
LTASIFGQALDTHLPARTNAELKPETRTAQALFEDANGYLGRRFQEFNKQNVPLRPQTRRKDEERTTDLALKNAGILRARTSLAPADVYYLGMLYHLGRRW